MPNGGPRRDATRTRIGLNRVTKKGRPREGPPVRAPEPVLRAYGCGGAASDGATSVEALGEVDVEDAGGIGVIGAVEGPGAIGAGVAVEGVEGTAVEGVWFMPPWPRPFGVEVEPAVGAWGTGRGAIALALTPAPVAEGEVTGRSGAAAMTSARRELVAVVRRTAWWVTV